MSLTLSHIFDNLNDISIIVCQWLSVKPGMRNQGMNEEWNEEYENMELEKPESVKHGIVKAGICKTRNCKSRNCMSIVYIMFLERHRFLFLCL